MNKFTPGPWAVSDKSDGLTLVALVGRKDGGGRGTVCQRIAKIEKRDAFEPLANARLIAAAPDMYAALVSIRDELLAEGKNCIQLNHAIAKAEGNYE